MGGEEASSKKKRTTKYLKKGQRKRRRKRFLKAGKGGRGVHGRRSMPSGHKKGEKGQALERLPMKGGEDPGKSRDNIHRERSKNNREKKR